MSEKRVLFNITDNIAARLTTRASLRGISRAYAVREIVERYLGSNPSIDSIVDCSLERFDPNNMRAITLYVDCELDDKVIEFSKRLSDSAKRSIVPRLVYRAALVYEFGFR